MATGVGTREQELSYFGLQSSWGVTKHLGGRAATDRLVESCGITRGSRVLEVGCGVGVTACYLARNLECDLTSVDLSEQMVDWARRRAEREGIADRIAFAVADVQALPFADGSFDAVISESVTAFAPDRTKAVGEYLRVLTPGGRVGLTEASWVKAPPPADLVAFLSQALGVRFLDPDGWWRLLEDGGFVDLRAQIAHLTVRGQLASDLGGQSRQDLIGRFRAMGSFVGQYLTDAEMRRYARTLTPSLRTMRDMFRYYGYGIYTGQKAR